MEKLIGDLSQFITVNGTKGNVSKAVVAYSVRRVWEQFIVFASCIFISFTLKAVWELIIFIVLFRSIRRYAGGLHCKHFASCYILSCVVIISTVMLAKYIYLPLYISLILYLHGSFMVIKIGIVESTKRIISKSEKEYFYNKLKKTIAIISGIVIVLFVIGANQLMAMSGLTMQIIYVSQLFGKKFKEGI